MPNGYDNNGWPSGGRRQVHGVVPGRPNPQGPRPGVDGPAGSLGNAISIPTAPTDRKDDVTPEMRALTYRDTDTKLLPRFGTERTPPLLGVAVPPSRLTTRTLRGTGVPIEITYTRPTLLLPYGGNYTGASTVFRVFATPEVPAHLITSFPTDLTGLTGIGGAVYIPTPGKWYVGAFTELGDSMQVIEYPTEDDRLVSAVLDGRDCWTNASFTVPVAVATVEIPFTTTSMFQQRYLLVENTGANPLRFVFGDETPSAAVGFLLNPGDRREFKGVGLPTAAFKTFSALGTSIHVILGIGYFA